MIRLEHATPRENLKQILERGLAPRWEWTGDRYVHEPIHLADEAPTAFLGSLHDVDMMAVLSVDLSDELAAELRLGHDGPGTWALYEWVPPTALTLIRVEERPKGDW